MSESHTTLATGADHVGVAGIRPGSKGEPLNSDSAGIRPGSKGEPLSPDSAGIRPGSKGEPLNPDSAGIRPGTKGDRLTSYPLSTQNTTSLTGTLEFPLDLSADWLPELNTSFAVQTLVSGLQARLGTQNVVLEITAIQRLSAQNLLQASFRLPEAIADSQDLLEISSPRSGLNLKTLVPALKRGQTHHLSDPLQLLSTAKALWIEKRQPQKKVSDYTSHDWFNLEAEAELQQLYHTLSQSLKNKKNLGKKSEELAFLTPAEATPAVTATPAPHPSASKAPDAKPEATPSPDKNTGSQSKKPD